MIAILLVLFIGACFYVAGQIFAFAVCMICACLLVLTS